MVTGLSTDFTTIAADIASRIATSVEEVTSDLVSAALDPFANIERPAPSAIKSADATAYFAEGDEDPAIDWTSIGTDDVQAFAFEEISREVREDARAVDELFAARMDALTSTTQPGKIYSLAEIHDILPEQIIAQFRELQDAGVTLKNISFVWAWNGDTPSTLFFRNDDPNAKVVVDEFSGEVRIVNAAQTNRIEGFGAIDSPFRAYDRNPLLGGAWHKPAAASPLVNIETAEVVTPDLSLDLFSGEGVATASSGMMLLGMMAKGMPIGPRLTEFSLASQRLLIRGGIGTGVILGIHHGVIAMGVPEEIAPYVDLPVTLGFFNALDVGSTFLADKGILSKPLFDGGIRWGHVAQAAPFITVANIGVAFGLDAMGCEFGSTCNTVGTIGTTTTGYLALSRTSNFLSEAYALSTGTGLTVQTVNIGSRAISLGSSGGFGGGVFLGGGGLAGGGGILAGGLQILGVAGAFALGNWLGGGLRDTFLYVGGYMDDMDYDLTSFTWKYMMVDHMGALGDSFIGNLVMGAQSILIPDEVYKSMEFFWSRWERGCNEWVDGVSGMLMQMTLDSIINVGSDSNEMGIAFSMHEMRKAVEREYTNTETPENCTNPDGCLDNATTIKNSYEMIERIAHSSQKWELDDVAKELVRVIDDEGEILGEARFKGLLTVILDRKQESGELYVAARRLLKLTRRVWANRMIELGLAKQVNGRFVPIRKKMSELTFEQKKFLTGGKSTYHRISVGQVAIPEDVHSEHIILRKKMAALAHIVRISDPSNGHAAKASEVIF